MRKKAKYSEQRSLCRETKAHISFLKKLKKTQDSQEANVNTSLFLFLLVLKVEKLTLMFWVPMLM